jgi:hypothetical protein
LCLLCLAAASGSAAVAERRPPPRPPDALSGSAFIESVAALERDAREEAILRELMRGNLPRFLLRLVPVTLEGRAADGSRHRVRLRVLPDYLAIGSDRDFVRMPMRPQTAQAFCDAVGFALPTRRLVEAVWRQAAVKLHPQPLVEAREAPATFLRHHRLIEEQLRGRRRGALVAGVKKDVVITARLQEQPRRVAIFGWHKPSGEPIQPLSLVHADSYVDYSHGVRPLSRRVLLDGREASYEEVLRDANLHALLSDEGALASPRQPR